MAWLTEHAASQWKKFPKVTFQNVYLRVGSKLKLKKIKSELIHETPHRLPYKDITQSFKNNVRVSHKFYGLIRDVTLSWKYYFD